MVIDPGTKLIIINLLFLKRLRTKKENSSDNFPTLQSIVDSEIAEGTNKGSSSCTLGLLWLKR